MKNKKRPLSPHLQIYRYQWTTGLSILHRTTGIILSASFAGILVWLIIARSSQLLFEGIAEHMHSWYGRGILSAWVFSVLYHTFNGMRHLVWDTGTWLALRSAYLSGLLTMVLSILCTTIIAIRYIF